MKSSPIDSHEDQRDPAPGGLPRVRRAEPLPAAVETLLVAAAVLVFTVCLWIMRGEIGLVWDEPFFIGRQHVIRDWIFQVLGSPEERSAALSKQGLEKGWPFACETPGEHGPVYAELSLLTGTLTGWLLGPLRGHRLAPLLLFAASCGVLFRFARRRWGLWAALAGVGCLQFDPRLFADAQVATTDVTVGAFWLLAVLAFLRSVETGKRLWLFGVLAALTTMSKVTGILVVLTTLLWTLVHRPPNALRLWGWTLFLVPIVSIAVHPRWWRQPIDGPLYWLRVLSDYQQKVPVCYLGVVYDSRETFVPWHNPIVVLATMIPIGLLALGLLGGLPGLRGVGESLRRRTQVIDPTTGLIRLPQAASCGLYHFLVLPVLRAFSIAPVHDGLRQLVPTLFFLGLLGACGAAWLDAATRRRGRPWVASVLVLGCLASAAWETVRIHPYEMSYYNQLIGGPVGAKKAGMESTYAWDAVNDDVLNWMNANLPPHAIVLIFPPPNVKSFDWNQNWGKLRTDFTFVEYPSAAAAALLKENADARPVYLIFLMRQGLYLPRPRNPETLFARLAEAPAVYELVPLEVGVRLVAIFDQEQFLEVVRRTKGN